MSKRDDNNQRKKVLLSDFLSAGANSLQMELVACEAGLKKSIQELAINRPGLALTGFMQHFAQNRLQVLGLAETAYLSSLDETKREKVLREFFASKIPCIVITRNKKVLPEIVELAEEFGVSILKSKLITKDFINAATIIMENLASPREKLQGTMIELMGMGILIEGKSGMGKSETALALLGRGAALISDDITEVRVDSSGSLIGSSLAVTRYHMEIRGIGIIHVPSLFGVASVRNEKRLDLVISLCKAGPIEDEERYGSAQDTRNLLGVDLPQVMVSVRSGRDIANIVETAALNEKLKRLGHDAAKELDVKLMSLMSGGKDGSD